MTQQLEAELTVGPKAIDAYSRLSYTMWFALAEFVDNSTQSRLNYGNLIDEVLVQEGRPLVVSIYHDRLNKTLVIEDNSIGMSKDDLIAALRIANPTPDSRGRSKYGMGMKTAACWIYLCELQFAGLFGAVRRLQEIWKWPRIWRMGTGGVH